MDPAKQSSDVCVRQWEALDQAFSWQSWIPPTINTHRPCLPAAAGSPSLLGFLMFPSLPTLVFLHFGSSYLSSCIVLSFLYSFSREETGGNEETSKAATVVLTHVRWQHLLSDSWCHCMWLSNFLLLISLLGVVGVERRGAINRLWAQAKVEETSLNFCLSLVVEVSDPDPFPAWLEFPHQSSVLNGIFTWLWLIMCASVIPKAVAFPPCSLNCCSWVWDLFSLLSS